MDKAIPVRIGALVSCAMIGSLFGAGIGSLQNDFSRTKYTEVLAEKFIARSEAVFDEAEAALAAANASSLSKCSSEDVAFLQGLIIYSRYLDSIGRKDGNYLICNAELGMLNPLFRLHDRDFITKSGYSLIFTDGLDRIPIGPSIIIWRDAAYVFVRNATLVEFIDSRLDFNLLARTPTRNILLGSSKSKKFNTDFVLENQEQEWIDGIQYEVRCSSSHPICIMAAIRSDAFKPDPWLMAGFTLMGALIGGAVGYIIGVVYKRARSLSRRLRSAIANDELSLVYQPIVDVKDNSLISLEVLTRWTLEDGNSISPDIFIAVAEEEGFVGDLTRYVLRVSMAEIATCLKKYPNISITINITAEDVLDINFSEYARNCCKNYDIPNFKVGFELTERKTACLEQLSDGIERLRDAGYYFYIDDFGVEYSNLSYLSSLHIDGIKLDRIFIAAVDQGANVIATQISELTSKLDMRLILEGIETEEQATFAAGLTGKILGQGWYYGKPMNLNEIENFISARGQRVSIV